MATQLTLNVRLPENISLANFCSENNGVLLTQLRQCADAGLGGVFFLWGGNSCGKSHLLQGSARLISEQGKASIYLPLQQGDVIVPEMLSDLESLRLIAIDDVDAVIGQPQWEHALFRLCHQAHLTETLLLLSSHKPLKQCTFVLSDLQSRLAQGWIFQINTISDGAKRRLLMERAEAKGLLMPASVADYLLHRCSREMADLFSLLERLDSASLEYQHRLTIPFVKFVLGL